MTVVTSARLDYEPRVMISDDGILTLQWQHNELGVALLFAGDGTVSIAFRSPGRFYAEGGIEVSVDEPLPAEFHEALRRIIC